MLNAKNNFDYQSWHFIKIFNINFFFKKNKIIKKLKILLLILFLPVLLFSQKTRTINGVVKDKNTGTEIENASVTAKPARKSRSGGFYTGEMTKENGLFSVRSSFRFPLELTIQIKL